MRSMTSTITPARSGHQPTVLSALPWLTAHLTIALVALVAIGGATRVMEAGLACPDWPLCYGSFLPGRQMNVQVFLEWFHRLDAFVVGVALLVLSGVSILRRRSLPGWLPWCSGAALVLVAIQGSLGALTVLQLLSAPVVTAHLATALLLVLLISALHQALLVTRHSRVTPQRSRIPSWWIPLSALAGMFVFAQCLLGGSMASQWAAESCFASGEGCRLLLLHRLGAWPAAVALLALALASTALPADLKSLRRLAIVPGVLVLLQVALGVLTMKLQLTVPAVTVAHQLLAALLVAVIGAIWGQSLPVMTTSPDPLPELEPRHG